MGSNLHSRVNSNGDIILRDRPPESEEMLRPLVDEMWRAGIDVLMSRQDIEPEVALIVFDSQQRLERFLAIVCRRERGGDTLFKRLTGRRQDPGSARQWRYEFGLSVVYSGNPEQEPVENGAVDLETYINVYFPQSDILGLLDRLIAHNERGGSS